LKRVIYNLYGFLNSLKYPKELFYAFKYMFNEKVFNNRIHIKLASDWLVFMQNSDGGYSRKFSLINGRDKSYIETTGYIIPTLWNVGEYLKEKKYIDSAKKAGEFLLNFQNEDGSFSEIDTNKPFAFDTGQCLIGLNFLYEKMQDKRFFESAKKAAYWLAKNQEEDGSWEKVAYNQEKHTYYSRVAAAMFRFSLLENDEYIKNKALKHIKWVLDNQLENGFFRYASFIDKIPAYLHTIVYILEGLLDVYEITKDERVLKSVLKNSEKFKEINLNRDLILCSQYDNNFNCVNNERCITGLAQWAGVCLRIFEITKDEDYQNLAISTLFYLKSKQIQETTTLKGALPASVPFWGKYGGFDFVNWGNKFFIDALLLLEKYKIDILKEQETFVSLAFRHNNSVVNENLTNMDKKYIKIFDKEFKSLKNKNLTFLDLGCGKGRFLNYFKKNYPNWRVLGIDPVFEGENIKKGSVYNIPLENESIDIIFTIEVLQHTYLNEALKEIKRVLKKDGFLVIGERNPHSILGVLKPFFEIKGKWMYPWDSPFREKWYNKDEWIEILEKNSFEIEQIETIEGEGKKFVNRYFFIKVKKW